MTTTFDINFDLDVDHISSPYADLDAEDIARMRKDFKGGAKKWAAFASERMGLDYQAEKRLKLESNEIRDIGLCGKPKMAMNEQGRFVETGEFYHCNRPNKCPRCAARQQRRLKERLEALDGHKYREVSKDERAELIAEYGKDAVYFQPLPNGKTLAVVNDDNFDGKEMTYQTASEFALVMPEGTKTSGNLGKVVTPKVESENMVPIMHNEYTVEDKEALQPAIDKMMQKTVDLLPETLEELQEAINTCEYWLQRFAKEMGLNIYLHRRVSFMVDKTKINWTQRHWAIMEERDAPLKPALSG